MRDTNKRNFELKARDMSIALKNALHERGLAYKSLKAYSGHVNQFTTYIKTEHNIKTLNQITREHVQCYADKLLERYEAGELSGASIKDYLCAVNVSLEQARMDTACRVEPRQAGFPTRSYIASNDKSINAEQHNKLKSQVDDRIASQLDLQRELGLRMKESCLINATAALREAEKRGAVTISSGTKGGKSREVPITSPKQLSALAKCAEIQGNDRSMIPTSMTFAQYQGHFYQKTQTGCHGERHYYANERYEALAGVASPVRAGIPHGQAHHTYIAQTLGIGLIEAKQLDDKVRLQVSRELGHERPAITNNYLG